MQYIISQKNERRDERNRVKLRSDMFGDKGENYL